MSRYIRAPQPIARLYVEDTIFPDEAPMIPSLTVDDSQCADTGLLWADGSRVMRAPNPIGFGSNLDG